MSPELEKILWERYPNVFPQDNDLSCPIAVGDGWFDLLDVLCNELTKEFNNASHRLKFVISTSGPQSLDVVAHQEKVEMAKTRIPQAVQIKEKFGGLRFYTTNSSEADHALISMAEQMSYRVCEDCGNRGHVYNIRWIRTLCPSCAIKQYGQEAIDKMMDKEVKNLTEGKKIC